MRHSAHKALGWLALLAGAAAAWSGNPLPPPAADEISALELARQLRAQPSGLRLVDLRVDPDSEDGLLPQAVPLTAFQETGRAGTRVVVYAEQSVDPATADALRARLALPELKRLQGGAQAWADEVLYPVLRRDAPPSRQRAFAERAALSRYFGGSPRLLDPGAVAPTHRSRRGC